MLYAKFLSNDMLFLRAMNRVINEWPVSCEQFLTNVSINRIAWLGQSAACIEIGVPSKFKSGFNLLSFEDRNKANNLANEVLIAWENKRIYK